MFRIISDGGSVGMTEAPNYVKQAKNGCFVLCPEPEASGIAFGGTVYHLAGREAIEGAVTVALEQTDGGTELEIALAGVEGLKADLATTDETAIQLYEAQLAKDEVDAAQDDALIELYEMIGG